MNNIIPFLSKKIPRYIFVRPNIFINAAVWANTSLDLFPLVSLLARNYCHKLTCSLGHSSYLVIGRMLILPMIIGRMVIVRMLIMLMVIVNPVWLLLGEVKHLLPHSCHETCHTGNRVIINSCVLYINAFYNPT